MQKRPGAAAEGFDVGGAVGGLCWGNGGDGRGRCGCGGGGGGGGGGADFLLCQGGPVGPGGAGAAPIQILDQNKCRKQIFGYANSRFAIFAQHDALGKLLRRFTVHLLPFLLLGLAALLRCFGEEFLHVLKAMVLVVNVNLT